MDASPAARSAFMSALRLVAVGLIVAGAAALIYRGFSYTKRHDVNIGPIDLTYDDRETVEIPVWIGVVALGAGTALLLARRTA
jgi:hypothetical protein